MEQLLASVTASPTSSAGHATPVEKHSLVSRLTTLMAVRLAAATQPEHSMRLSHAHKQAGVCARGTLWD